MNLDLKMDVCLTFTLLALQPVLSDHDLQCLLFSHSISGQLSIDSQWNSPNWRMDMRSKDWIGKSIGNERIIIICSMLVTKKINFVVIYLTYICKMINLSNGLTPAADSDLTLSLTVFFIFSTFKGRTS